MINEPRTKAEAEKRRYGVWGGNPKGNVYNPNQCAMGVTTAWTPGQCTRKPGHGPDSLYCKQHDPDALAAKRKARDAKWIAESKANDALTQHAKDLARRLGVGGHQWKGGVLLTNDEAETLLKRLRAESE